MLDPSLHGRIAKALGWTPSEVHSMSLAALRDVVRPQDPALSAEISDVIARGTHVARGPRRRHGNTPGVGLVVKLGANGLPAEWRPVADLAAASRAVRSFISSHGLGASTWAGGDVRAGSSKGDPVARVSYNGRVWPPGRWTSKMVALWEPQWDR